MTKYFQETSKNIYILLFIATVCVFLGRAWQHLFWDAPYRVLLWDEDLMRGFIENYTNYTWQTWTTDTDVDAAIVTNIKRVGEGYMMLALITSCMFLVRIFEPTTMSAKILTSRDRHLSVHRYSMTVRDWFMALSRIAHILGSVGLLILAALYCKDKWFHIGQFFEYTLQIVTPLFFAFYKPISASHEQSEIQNPQSEIEHSEMESLTPLALSEIRNPKPEIAMVFAIALTFVCHGLYAVGYYPQPENYVTMTLNILHCEETTARVFLKVMGWLDMLAAMGLLILPLTLTLTGFQTLTGLGLKVGTSAAFQTLPTLNNIFKISLIYCIVWGFLTMLARLWAHFYIDIWAESLHQNLYQCLIRVPHFVVPLVVLKRIK